MARIEKTVFISYRRTDVYTALAVYENLKNQGYDVFFDYRSISSGDFEQIITSNIKARAHFLLILTPTALDRCNEPGDWLRREIELAIDEKRNIVPLFLNGFRFGMPAVKEKLTGKLKNISRYNGLNVHEDYFEEAMHRVREQFLIKPMDTVLHPVSTEIQKVVKEEQEAADEAIKKREVNGALLKSVPDQVDKQAELDSLNSIAIQHELKGDFWNALQLYYKIKKIDPTFPRVDIKIREMELESQPRRKTLIDSSALTNLIVTIGAIVIFYFGFTTVRDFAPPPTSIPSTPLAIITATVQPSAIPTDTVPPGDPTSTLAPPTDTPEPTPLPLWAGEDWLSGCISTVWTVFPSYTSFSSNDGCYIEPLVQVFSARNRHLEFFVDKNVSSSDIVGIFTEIPSDSIVDLSIHLDQIETGELLIGIFSEMDIQSHGLLVVVPEGNEKNIAFVVYKMPENELFYMSSNFKNDWGEYEIQFDVSPINVFANFERYTRTSSIPVPSEKKYLFIGYKAIDGKTNRILGYFYNLVITPR